MNNTISHFMNNIMKTCVLAISLFPALANANLYFNAKVYGPVTNIYAVDDAGKVDHVTKNTAWKDIEHDVSKLGDVVFTSNRDREVTFDLNKTFDVFDVYLYRHDSGTMTKLTDSREREYSPRFNTTGEYIAYLHLLPTKRTELRLVNIEGKDDQLLVEAKDIFDFSWSPDGKKIVYSEASDTHVALKTINVTSGKSRELIFDNIEKNLTNFNFLTAPSWSPDGEKIAYVTHPSDKNRKRNLYTIDINTKKIQKMSKDSMQVQAPVQWSKDSQSILYSSLLDYDFFYDEKLKDKVYKGSMQIFITDISGKSRQLTQGDHFHGRPTFSPDGNKIAYLFSEKLGGASRYALKVLDMSNGSNKELYKSVQRGSQLVWQ